MGLRVEAGMRFAAFRNEDQGDKGKGKDKDKGQQGQQGTGGTRDTGYQWPSDSPSGKKERGGHR